VFTASWCADKPLAIAYGGSDGDMGIWNLESSEGVLSHFAERIPALDEDLRGARAEAAQVQRELGGSGGDGEAMADSDTDAGSNSGSDSES
jgi:hypothetical protein